MRSMILEGGIKGWATGGPEYVNEMEGYEEDVWKKEGKV
jgi:arsenical-resistance protein 2